MKKQMFLFFTVLLLISLLCACATGMTGESIASAEKTVVLSQGLYPEYTFEEACREANRIVIGTVIEVAEPTLYQVVPDRDLYEASTAFTLSVETTIKGEHEDTVIFKQEGGETEDKIYKVEGIELPEKGDRLLLFLNERGLIITPDFGLDVDSNGNIVTTHFPEGYLSTATADSNTISADDYAGLIKDYLEN